MKLRILDEPELEFGGHARHIDPRFGIMDYGTADSGTPRAPSEIRVGFIGTQRGIEGARDWLNRCRTEIPAKTSHLRSLFPLFPGFEASHSFRSTLVFDAGLERPLADSAVQEATAGPPAHAVRATAELFISELEQLIDRVPRCDVAICVRPETLHDTSSSDEVDETGSDVARVDPRLDFHDLLKAKSLALRVPIQLMRRETWDPQWARASRKEKGSAGSRQVQDEATRAWNLHVALYYKAGGVPWRLPRSASDLTTLFVGVSFFQTLDRQALHTAVAEVFDERGDGIIVRGGEAKVSKDDRQPHLPREAARSLLNAALAQYRSEHRNFPARLVMQKSSSYSGEELEGFGASAEENKIHSVDLVWLPTTETARLFRRGQNPPLRGTFLSMDERRHTLYTKGSVDFYRSYPGMYVPKPLGIRLVQGDSGPVQIASEILALTKMNWNQAQLDGRLPITLRTATQVGHILKYVEPDQPVAARYAHYM